MDLIQRMELQLSAGVHASATVREVDSQLPKNVLMKYDNLWYLFCINIFIRKPFKLLFIFEANNYLQFFRL